ncbi:uncharacterized protein F5147DRAFT_778483 [Suillus discolor]|uniref:Uncharacterized protein n=1 Tax=Suillus discolor TaxID=1912936 RepID=A0A9P7EX97_9AGAM|nr:uncharacterized protein F5147DRAFT_778483 [Suillus discolor]KAG2096119.1 hypothetical protein F5147DRAFT_778483 [Suillus discolor]
MATFHSVDHFQASSDGFISLMDDPALVMAPSPSMPTHQLQPSFEDGDEDLDFGNNANKCEHPAANDELKGLVNVL